MPLAGISGMLMTPSAIPFFSRKRMVALIENELKFENTKWSEPADCAASPYQAAASWFASQTGKDEGTGETEVKGDTFTDCAASATAAGSGPVNNPSTQTSGRCAGVRPYQPNSDPRQSVS